MTAYRKDKSASEKRGSWRTSVNKFMWLNIAGGWIGGIIGRLRFDHKTRKRSFQFYFWLSAVLNIFITYNRDNMESFAMELTDCFI